VNRVLRSCHSALATNGSEYSSRSSGRVRDPAYHSTFIASRPVYPSARAQTATSIALVRPSAVFFPCMTSTTRSDGSRDFCRSREPVPCRKTERSIEIRLAPSDGRLQERGPEPLVRSNEAFGPRMFFTSSAFPPPMVRKWRPTSRTAAITARTITVTTARPIHGFGSRIQSEKSRTSRPACLVRRVSLRSTIDSGAGGGRCAAGAMTSDGACAGAAGAGAAPVTFLKCRRVWPTATQSPGWSLWTSLILLPLRIVPFMLPLSRMNQSPSAKVKTQCSREQLVSLSVSPHFEERPTLTGPSPRSNANSWSGP
jgi:hypothetical protein